MHTRPTQTVAANVRAELGRLSIKQATLAEHMGITQSQLSKRLNGQIEFGVDEVVTIARHLKVPVSTLLPEAVATDA